jgi:hypothetical protein
MIKIENTDVFGWESAIRGMRNPMNSWDKSDSYYDWWEDPSPINPNDEVRLILGENDLKLMKTLSKAGNDHAKFLRMINVTIDITAPLYWWKEFDTYKVGTVANSCSTMHKIHSKEFELDDFSHEHLYSTFGESYEAMDCLVDVVSCLNKYRERYLVNKDKFWWWQMIQLLPSSYNQKRTVQLNYAVLKNMYFSRRNHKLDEWRTFCDWALTLPYFKEICVDEQ